MATSPITIQPFPAGKDGESVNVYGPQSALPAPERPGDVWLVDMDLRAIEEAMIPEATLVPATPAEPAAALSPIPDYPVIYLQHVDHSYPRLLRSK